MLLKHSVALILGLFWLAACGQKGPLYLPGDPSQIQTDIPRQEQVIEIPDEDEEDEDQDERQ